MKSYIRKIQERKQEIRTRIHQVKDIEKIYFPLELRFAEIGEMMNSGRVSLQLYKEHSILSTELDRLGDDLASSYIALFNDGSLIGKLIGYWWRWGRHRQF